MAMEFRALPFTFGAHVLAIAGAIMVLVWTLYYRGGLDEEHGEKGDAGCCGSCRSCRGEQKLRWEVADERISIKFPVGNTFLKKTWPRNRASIEDGYKMVRPPCCDKLNGKRGPWTADEDAKILAHVAKHGTGNWTAVPNKAGFERCGKSCRIRWNSSLRPDLEHDNFTPQEEEMIIRLHAAIGSRWSIIAQQLPGRTDNDVKKCWNSRLRKKLSEMGIDPVTHKPLSKILADYGNIGGLVSGSRIGSLSRDLKNVLTMKPEKHNSILPEGISNIDSHLMTTMLPPKMEPVQEFLLNKFNYDSTNGNHSLDLLYQLQAIKMVIEASGTCAEFQTMLEPSYNVFDEGSSSSSTCSIEAQENLPASSSWCEFLLEDQFLPSDPQAEQENAAELSSKDLTNQAQMLL